MGQAGLEKKPLDAWTAFAEGSSAESVGESLFKTNWGSAPDPGIGTEAINPGGLGVSQRKELSTCCRPDLKAPKRLHLLPTLRNEGRSNPP